MTDYDGGANSNALFGAFAVQHRSLNINPANAARTMQVPKVG